MVVREIFSRRLDALRDYLVKVIAFKAVSRKDFVRRPEVHDLAERYLHLMMECVLDLGNHYLADRHLGVAETNRDIFLMLREAGELDASLASALAQWAGFRNVLAHEYLRLDHGVAWDAIQTKLEPIRQFYDWAVSKLDAATES